MPISAFGGADDPLVARDEVAAWAHVTRGGFRMRILPGGHFFHHVARREIAAAVLTPPPGVDG